MQKPEENQVVLDQAIEALNQVSDIDVLNKTIIEDLEKMVKILENENSKKDQKIIILEEKVNNSIKKEKDWLEYVLGQEKGIDQLNQLIRHHHITEFNQLLLIKQLENKNSDLLKIIQSKEENKKRNSFSFTENMNHHNDQDNESYQKNESEKDILIANPASRNRSLSCDF